MPPTKNKVIRTSESSGKRWNLSIWDKVKIIDREEHWIIRRLKELAHMLGYSDLLSTPSIEMNTIWEPKIRKVVNIAKDEDNSLKTLNDKKKKQWRGCFGAI